MGGYNFFRAVSIDVNNKLLPGIYQHKSGILVRKGVEVSSKINFFI